jgi:MtaA/CmuA family methyltransferase
MAAGMADRLARALTGGRPDRAPATGLMTSVTYELMELCGVRYPEAHGAPEEMVALAAAAFEHAGLESMKLPFDMTVEAEALGCAVDYGDARTLPQVKRHAYDAEAPGQLDGGGRGFLDRGRVPIVLEAIALARRRYDGIIPVVSSVVGPFTLATNLFGIEPILVSTITEPALLKDILAKTTQICKVYAAEQINAGCNVLSIGEAACSGNLISSATYGEFIAPVHKDLCAGLAVPSVVHICGDITGHLDYIEATGMSGISFDYQTDIGKARALLKTPLRTPEAGLRAMRAALESRRT